MITIIQLKNVRILSCDLLKLICHMVTVKQVMTSNPITLNESDTMENALTLFKKHNFHHLPVVNEANSLIGIISSSDLERTLPGSTLFKVVNLEEYNSTVLQANLVTQIMKKEVVSVDEDMPIEDAYVLLKKNQFRCLPVISSNKLSGILTSMDILEYIFTHFNNKLN